MPLVLLLEYCWVLRKGEGKKNKGEKDKHLQTVLVLKLVSRASLVPKKKRFCCHGSTAHDEEWPRATNAAYFVTPC